MKPNYEIDNSEHALNPLLRVLGKANLFIARLLMPDIQTHTITNLDIQPSDEELIKRGQIVFGISAIAIGVAFSLTLEH